MGDAVWAEDHSSVVEQIALRAQTEWRTADDRWRRLFFANENH